MCINFSVPNVYGNRFRESAFMYKKVFTRHILIIREDNFNMPLASAFIVVNSIADVS